MNVREWKNVDSVIALYIYMVSERERERREVEFQGWSSVRVLIHVAYVLLNMI